MSFSKKILKLYGVKQIRLPLQATKQQLALYTRYIYLTTGIWLVSFLYLLYTLILILLVNPSGYVIFLKGLYRYRLYAYSIVEYHQYKYILSGWVFINILTIYLTLKFYRKNPLLFLLLLLFLTFVNLLITEYKM